MIALSRFDLYEIYRTVLLMELVGVMAMHVFSIVNYWRSYKTILDPGIRFLYSGLLARMGGVSLILLLFIMAVIASYGEKDVGALAYNLIIQGALILFILAWGRVDRQRFTHVEEPQYSPAALTAIERLERSERHRIEKALRARRERESA